jgi:hypothetical protein
MSTTYTYESKIKPRLKEIEGLFKIGMLKVEIANYLGIDRRILYRVARRHTDFGEIWFNEKNDIYKKNAKVQKTLSSVLDPENLIHEKKNAKGQNTLSSVLDPENLIYEKKIKAKMHKILDMVRCGYTVLDIAVECGVELKVFCALVEKFKELDDVLKLSPSYVKLKVYRALVDAATGDRETVETYQQLYQGKIWTLRKVTQHKPDIAAVKFLLCNEWPEEFKLLDRKETIKTEAVTIVDDL